MRTLYLTRHAKSEKGFTGVDDFDRPLNERGIHNASAMAALMKGRNFIPVGLLTSPAVRAMSTACIFARVMEIPWDRIHISEAIYEADEQTLLSVFQGIPDRCSSVMAFGHNPGFTEIANLLTGEKIENIPTSAVVCIDFEVDSWQQISPGNGKMRFFETPRKSIKSEC
jgi:phosphohistidine phosphatase